MKTRSDFVSNSSSSSFIIAGDDQSFCKKFNLGKKDFEEALQSLYGKDTLDKYMKDYPDHVPFYVKDKEVEEDRKFMDSDECTFLRDWTNYILFLNRTTGEWSSYNEAEKFGTVYEALKEVYDLPWHYEFDGENLCEHYDRENNKWISTPMPDDLGKIIKDLYCHFGVATNYDVLKANFSRFLFHFEDNEIWNLDGTDGPSKDDKPRDYDDEYSKKWNEALKNSKYETEHYTCERVIEVLFNWFKDHGKLKGLSDETWEDLNTDVVAETMHEG